MNGCVLPNTQSLLTSGKFENFHRLGSSSLPTCMATMSLVCCLLCYFFYICRLSSVPSFSWLFLVCWIAPYFVLVFLMCPSIPSSFFFKRKYKIIIIFTVPTKSLETTYHVPITFHYNTVSYQI